MKLLVINTIGEGIHTHVPDLGPNTLRSIQIQILATNFSNTNAKLLIQYDYYITLIELTSPLPEQLTKHHSLTKQH